MQGKRREKVIRNTTAEILFVVNVFSTVSTTVEMRRWVKEKRRGCVWRTVNVG